jgi:dTDP-glucose 4,6-dehydratase
VKILITGGAGFIGSNFTEYMLKKYKNHKLAVFDLLTYASNPDTIKKFVKYKNFKFIKGDIRNKKAVDKAVGNTDAVINFAAETHVDRSIINPDIFVETNIKGTNNLLESAKKYRVKRFIQISTDEVYGSIKSGKSKEGDLIDPTSPYSASKAAADLIALSYYKTFSVPVIITRSSNNFGPYQHPEKFMPLFITNALEDKDLPLYGDGKNVRNWIYVEDNCRGIDYVLRKGKDGEVYNIGGNVEIQNIKVAMTITKFLNKPDALIRPVKDRPAHDRRYALDSAKIKKLGWRPKYNFSRALKKTIDWYKDNKKWWMELKNQAFKNYYKNWYEERK